MSHTTVLLSLVAGLATTTAIAQQQSPIYRADAGVTTLTLPTGEQVQSELTKKWKFICGTDETNLTVDDLAGLSQQHEQAVVNQQAESFIINTPRRGGGFDVIFNVIGTPPAGALDGLLLVEQAIESRFLDNSTVRCTLRFQNLGGGILGGASSSQATINYATYRDALIADQDADDTIEDFLPTSSTLPVRFVGTSSNVSNVNNLRIQTASVRAAGIPNGASTDVDIVINTSFNFDYNPSNGVFGTSFVDVMIHEVGHGMGFTSAVDNAATNPTPSPEPIDLYRFQRTDGGNDFNPDTLAEFGTTARLIDFNSPNGAHNMDFIDNEYRMEDGSPSQASHFLEQGSNIGIMDPSISGGQSFLTRGYYSDADLQAFDAIGYDFVDAVAPLIINQPEGASACSGEDVTSLSITAAGSNLDFLWFKDGTPLLDQTNSTLPLIESSVADSGDYQVLVSNNFGSVFSDTVTVTISPSAALTTDVQDVEVNAGEDAVFSFELNGELDSVVWLVNGSAVLDAGSTLTLTEVSADLDGASVSALVTGVCGFVTSRTATLTVNADEPCVADVNGDGELNGLDFGAWLGAFNAGLPTADQNGDNIVNGLDFGAWLSNFNAGCN